LILPGWGQHYAGAKGRAKAFLASEFSLWAGFVAFRIYGNWRAEDYRLFAATHAGVKIEGKSKEYWTDLSNYRDIYEYNEEKRRFRAYEEVYPITEDYFWRWDSEDSRRTFDRLWHSSERAYRNATLTIGIILLNHVISAIDAIWTLHRYQRSGRLPRWHLQTRSRLRGPYFVSIGLHKEF